MQNSKITDENSKKQEALFKFSIIAPFVNDCHAYKSQMAFFRDAAKKEYTLPNR